MANRIDLSGRFAVVTGGAQGIGRAVTERLLDSGAAVAIWDRDAALAQATAAELGSRGTARAVTVDVTKLAEVERARDETLAAFKRIDILVNNAGIAGPNTTTWEYPPEAWSQVMAVNLDSQFYCCRAIVPSMIAQNYGRIVNVASIAGKEGTPGVAAYCASKAGVIGFSKALAKEVLASGVTVNCIAPVMTETELLRQMTPEHIQRARERIPMGRFCTLDEIAAMVAWIASPECSFTTGAVFDLSGGRASY